MKTKNTGKSIIVKSHTRAGHPVKSYTRGGGFSEHPKKDRLRTKANNGYISAMKRNESNNNHIGAMKSMSHLLGDGKMFKVLTRIGTVDRNARNKQGFSNSEPPYVTRALTKISRMIDKRMVNKYGKDYPSKMLYK